MQKGKELFEQLQGLKQVFVYTLFPDVQNTLKEKVEERWIGLEKQLNKRFLKLDSNFSSFKGIVIDETEDLIKELNDVLKNKIDEVNNVVKNKIEEVNSAITKKVSEFNKNANQNNKLIEQNLTKMNFSNNESSNVVKEFKELYHNISTEITENRNEINDIRVKMDIFTTHEDSVNEHIYHMRVYEEQLIALIQSLKEKGIQNDAIKTALMKKGHPRYYINMIIDNF